MNPDYVIALDAIKTNNINVLQKMKKYNTIQLINAYIFALKNDIKINKKIETLLTEYESKPLLFHNGYTLSQLKKKYCETTNEKIQNKTKSI